MSNIRNDISRVKVNFTSSGPEYIKSDIRVTIGMLVSNRIEYIRKCMDSIKPILDNVPSELICIDTVGEEKSDGSLAVVKEYTDKVYHFDWCDDFSAARNAAMDRARGEWFMYLDDDEYFDDVSEFISFFNSEECHKYGNAFYYTGDYTDKTHFSKSVAGRMVRRTKNTRFVGIVHECFNEVYRPVKQFNAFTHHFGYLFQTPESKQKHYERNYNLLLKELNEKGINVRTCGQIIQEMMFIDHPDAFKTCVSYINRLEGTGELNTNIGQWLLVANLRYLAVWNSLPGVLDVEKKLYENYRLKEISKLACAYYVARVAYSNNEYDVALDHAKIYLENYAWLQEHTEERLEQINLDFPQYLDNSHRFSLLNCAVLAAVGLKKYDTAFSYLKMIDYDDAEEQGMGGKMYDTVMEGLEDDKTVLEYYRSIYRPELFEDPALHKYLPETVRKRLKNRK